MPVEVGLTAAICAVAGDQPTILTTRARDGTGEEALPSGPFDPVAHRTFEIGLRAWVSEQTGAPLGYVEQLYTFGDRGRHAEAGDLEPHVVSVGYLALTRQTAETVTKVNSGYFRPWYLYFPWEDFRKGKPRIIDEVLVPHLQLWAEAATGKARAQRLDRIRFTFGLDGVPFDEERTLERYECLYSAGLVQEARRDRRLEGHALPPVGQPMRYDHRRILATAMGRLRAKLKYRPVIFELMPQVFTLTALQNTVEAISGRHLHKQNFRRLVEGTALVEPTGGVSRVTGGRPAALFRFRREVLQERPAPGLRLGGRG
jgi:hypothetical protein